MYLKKLPPRVERNKKIKDKKYNEKGLIKQHVAGFRTALVVHFEHFLLELRATSKNYYRRNEANIFSHIILQICI